MWALIFLMLVLKIPILYLCAVVWWAIKSEPEPTDGAAVPAVPPDDGPPRRGPRRPRIPRPHGGPIRSYARARRNRTNQIS